MASTSTTAPATAPSPPHMEPLKTWQRIGCKIGIYFAAMLLCIGIGGIFVVTDKEQKNWLSNTPFGELWRYLMTLNAIFIPAITNAGILGLLLCGYNLQYDHKARFGDPKKETATSKAPKKKTRAKKVD